MIGKEEILSLLLSLLEASSGIIAFVTSFDNSSCLSLLWTSPNLVTTAETAFRGRMTLEIALLTSEQLSELKRQLDQSEAMHHKIMAKMGDERFDLLDAWERKERLDQEIGRFIRASMGR